MSAVQVAVAFTWLGMVLAISFVEAPLKFRAPGITVQLGVGIGRLVFRALNIAEGVFAVALLVTAVIAGFEQSGTTTALILAVAADLVIGACVLRPLMDRRVARGEAADRQPRHALHIAYVALECLKVALLVIIGITALLG